MSVLSTDLDKSRWFFQVFLEASIGFLVAWAVLESGSTLEPNQHKQV